MGRRVPYIFYRYSIEHAGQSASWFEHDQLFRNAVGVEVSYRKINPTEQDRDTSLVALNHLDVSVTAGNNIHIIYFQIAKHITTREILNYDRPNDRLNPRAVSTDEYATSQIITIPVLRLLAASNRNGATDINASSAVGRLAAIIRSFPDHRLHFQLAATTADIRRALEAWTVSEFGFTARPFNPSVHTPGAILSDLFSNDEIFIAGKAKPLSNDHISVSNEGFISEVLGLSEYGNAEIGASGTTEEGHIARIKKGNPYKDELTSIQVYIPESESIEIHIKEVAQAMIEIYGQKK